MDYSELATELLQKMFQLHKAQPQKRIAESMQGEVFMLHYIAQHEEDVLPGEISSEMDISSARVAAALNSLESKGLITRRIDPGDRRRILVRLTGEGLEVTRARHRAVIEQTAGMLGLLGECDAREYVRIMGRLADIIATRG